MGVLDQDAIRFLTGLGCDALFNTYCFLLVFLPLVVLGTWLVPARWRLGWLAAASLAFYGFWDARFIALLVSSAVVDFVVALRIERARLRQEPRTAKHWLWISIAFNLGMLAFWKYAMFFAENAVSLARLVGVDAVPPGWNIVLPVGISFYTFQTLSYAIDVYRGHVDASRDFTAYLAYVTMFPQLVAGPIVRYRFLEGQFQDLPKFVPWNLVAYGVSLFAVGLAKKVLIADTIAGWSDPLWADAAEAGVILSTAGAWTAALGYTAQLYFDFSGYSDMAIGLGAMLGFRYPINFDAPYKARDPSDFWRRWHISLSTFLRDYLYIPLGGNRGGVRRTDQNLLIVMLLGGLWHGAAWTFVAWGAYHGLALIIHRHHEDRWARLPVAAQRAGMLLVVVVGWVLFRSPDMATAGSVLTSMFVPVAGAIPAGWWFILATLAATQVLGPTSRAALQPSWIRAFWTALLLVACLAAIGANESPFLYYQF